MKYLKRIVDWIACWSVGIAMIIAIAIGLSILFILKGTVLLIAPKESHER